MLFFSFEMIVLIMVKGLVVGEGAYLRSWWHRLDPVIVAVTWIDSALPTAQPPQVSSAGTPPGRMGYPAPGTAHRDYWEEDGGLWIRYHCTPRRSLFTPSLCRVGPDRRPLGQIRETILYYADGTTETIVDKWDEPGSDRKLPRLWAGRTMFRPPPPRASPWLLHRSDRARLWLLEGELLAGSRLRFAYRCLHRR